MRKSAKVYDASEAVEGMKPKVTYESHKKCTPGEFGARVKEAAQPWYAKALSGLSSLAQAPKTVGYRAALAARNTPVPGFTGFQRLANGSSALVSPPLRQLSKDRAFGVLPSQRRDALEHVRLMASSEQAARQNMAIGAGVAGTGAVSALLRPNAEQSQGNAAPSPQLAPPPARSQTPLLPAMGRKRSPLMMGVEAGRTKGSSAFEFGEKIANNGFDRNHLAETYWDRTDYNNALRGADGRNLPYPNPGQTVLHEMGQHGATDIIGNGAMLKAMNRDPAMINRQQHLLPVIEQRNNQKVEALKKFEGYNSTNPQPGAWNGNTNRMPKIKSGSAFEFGEKIAFNFNSIDWNALKQPALGGAALGALGGGLAGLINPGEDGRGNPRSRFGAMLRGAVDGGLLGGAGGALAGHFAPGPTQKLVNSARMAMDPVNYQEPLADAMGQSYPATMRIDPKLRATYNAMEYGAPYGG